MYKRAIFSVMIILSGLPFFTAPANAFDWKALHEQADKISPASALERANINPQDAADAYVLGLVYLNSHKDKEADDIFVRLARLDANNIAAQWGRAEVLRRRHKTKESEEILKKVMAEAPAFWPAHVTLAYIRYNQMDFEAAVRLAGLVLDQGKNSVDTSNKARALLIVGGARGMLAYYGGFISKIVNGTQILRNVKKAQSLQPQSAAVMFGLGSYYLLAPGFAGGDKEEAQKFLLKTVGQDPLFADAYVRLAQLYKAKRDMVKYSFYLNKAREIDPDNELAADIDSGRCKFVCLD